VKIERVLDMGHGDQCTVSTLSMGSHTGTHMDAPAHFVRGGLGLDQMPLDATIGPARVIEIADRESIKIAEIGEVARGERILFKTLNSARCWKTDEFVPDFVYISTEAGRYLAERGVMTVGVDYLSVGGYEKNGLEVHRAILEAGIWIIEGLDLSNAKPGPVELVCLPLKVLGGDGAPCRAIVRQ
jgi:arylformamidase